jgi:hypothetical protein
MAVKSDFSSVAAPDSEVATDQRFCEAVVKARSGVSLFHPGSVACRSVCGDMNIGPNLPKNVLVPPGCYDAGEFTAVGMDRPKAGILYHLVKELVAGNMDNETANLP